MEDSKCFPQCVVFLPRQRWKGQLGGDLWTGGLPWLNVAIQSYELGFLCSSLDSQGWGVWSVNVIPGKFLVITKTKVFIDCLWHDDRHVSKCSEVWGACFAWLLSPRQPWEPLWPHSSLLSSSHHPLVLQSPNPNPNLLSSSLLLMRLPHWRVTICFFTCVFPIGLWTAWD